MSAISIKPSVAVVKVMMPLGENAAERPALVFDRRGRRAQNIHLSPETRAAIGGDLFGYFEAEMIDGQWWIGKRLPDGERGW